MHTRHYHNGLKTTVLLGGMWALLLAIGYAIALGTRQSMWIFIFAGIGLIQIVWSYWKSWAANAYALGGSHNDAECFCHGA